YDLQAEEAAVIGHHHCGMSAVNTANLQDKMKQDGISDETFTILHHAGLHFHVAFHRFASVDASAQRSVDISRNHPRRPTYLKVQGLVVDPQIGQLDVVDLKDETKA